MNTQEPELITNMRREARYLHNVMQKQVRKYTGEPYTEHTEEVARLYAAAFPEDVVGIAAALGHDLIEDTPVTSEEILTYLHHADARQAVEVLHTIWELTEEFSKEKYPHLNRQQRKTLECHRLSHISIRAKNIKLCDMISNTRSIVEHDPEFARTYLAEKSNILKVLTDADRKLWATAQSLCDNGLAMLNAEPVRA